MNRKLAPLGVLIILGSFVYSKVDWWTMTLTSNNTWATMLRYWAWQNAFWMLFGLTVALAYWAGAKSNRETTIISITIFVTFGLVMLSNTLDWAYFWFNTHVLPPIDQKWTWMPQSWALGFDWGTPEQVRWTIAWLLSIPLVWGVVLKYLLPKWGT